MGARRTFRKRVLKELRSWPFSGFENYLIFYRFDEARLEVLRVIHGARDLERALLE
jgi:toxin ParE1/3/4